MGRVVYDGDMTNKIEVGNVVRWGSAKQRHYGVVVEVDGDRVRVEYTHSTPSSTVKSGRVLDLNRSIHKELRAI